MSKPAFNFNLIVKSKPQQDYLRENFDSKILVKVLLFSEVLCLLLVRVGGQSHYFDLVLIQEVLFVYDPF